MQGRHLSAIQTLWTCIRLQKYNICLSLWVLFNLYWLHTGLCSEQHFIISYSSIKHFLNSLNSGSNIYHQLVLIWDITGIPLIYKHGSHFIKLIFHYIFVTKIKCFWLKINIEIAYELTLTRAILVRKQAATWPDFARIHIAIQRHQWKLIVIGIPNLCKLLFCPVPCGGWIIDNWFVYPFIYICDLHKESMHSSTHNLGNSELYTNRSITAFANRTIWESCKRKSCIQILWVSNTIKPNVIFQLNNMSNHTKPQLHPM